MSSANRFSFTEPHNYSLRLLLLLFGPIHPKLTNPAAKASDTTSPMERARALAASTLAMTSFPRLQHWFLGQEVHLDVLHWRSLQHPKNYDAARLHEASNSTFPLCRSPTGADIRLITRISPRSSACTLPPPDFPRQTVRSWKWKSCEKWPLPRLPRLHLAHAQLSHIGLVRNSDYVHSPNSRAYRHVSIASVCSQKLGSRNNTNKQKSSAIYCHSYHSIANFTLTTHLGTEQSQNYRANSARNASENRLIASSILSAGAAAYVARKNILSSGMPWSARNQLPRESNDPRSTDSLKMASSISSCDCPLAKPGCFFQDTSIQCYQQTIR